MKNRGKSRRLPVRDPPAELSANERGTSDSHTLRLDQSVTLLILRSLARGGSELKLLKTKGVPVPGGLL